MAISPLVRLNGKMMTRSSCAIRVNGVFRLTDVDSTDWSDERPVELVGAMNDGGLPAGKALGNYTCDASIGIYVDAADAFETALNLGPALPGDPFDLTSSTFSLIISMREDVRLRVVTLVNCTIKSRATSIGSDGASLILKYGLQPLAVLENGKTLATLIPAL